MKSRLILVAVFLVFAGCGDKEPHVRITAPADGDVVGGTVYISAELENAPDVISVGFYIDDTLRYFKQTEPYVYAWQVTALTDSIMHKIYVKASLIDEDYAYSETISVMIYNATLIADDFENYFPGEYPALGGWFCIWSGSGYEETFVDTSCGYSSEKSFRLTSSPTQVRTDGVFLNFQNVHKINYECAAMIPEGDVTGALCGFFVFINPSLGAILNGVLFDCNDHMVYARGVNEVGTGMSWLNGYWYNVKVSIDYDSLTMDVWINERQLVDNAQAAPRDTSNVFAVSTEFDAGGTAYFDDVEIYK